MKTNKKKTIFILIGILVVVGAIVGVSYALWVTTTNQQSINRVKSDCLKIELKDKTAAIQLENAYPIRDKEAKELVPYEFTIRNTCNSLIKYDVNLEIMDLGENQLATQYISVSIDNGGKKRLGEQESIDPTYKDSTYTANEARSLLKKRELAGGAEQTYALRIWMDESVTQNDPVINKEFLAKISVTASMTEAGSTMMARADQAFWQEQYRTNISKIVLEDQYNPHQTSEELIFDVSAAKDKSVMAYLVETETSTEEAKDYTLYIQGKGGIKAPGNSSNLFSAFTKLQEIKNIEVLDTSNVTDMLNMFSNCPSLINLNLSHFNTSKVFRMESMFYGCSGLLNLDLSSFDTSQVTTMNNMCLEMSSLEEIKGILDLENVTNANNMLSYCQKLKEVRLKNLKTNLLLNTTMSLSDDSVNYLLLNVQDVSVAPKTITLGPNMPKASKEALEHATSLGWTVI